MNTLEMVMLCIAALIVLIGIGGLIIYRRDTRNFPNVIYFILTVGGILIGIFISTTISARHLIINQREACISNLQSLGDNRNDSLFILTLAPCDEIRDSILVKMATEPEVR